MTLLLPFIAAIGISFPADGAKLPYLEKCYAIGWVRPYAPKITVAGTEVEVYKTGAWAALVDVAEGTNEIAAVCGGENAVSTVVVAAKPSGCGPVPVEKKWEKLAFAADVPKPHPSGKPPEETVIVVDAGHGGHDTGAKSPHGFFEKDANLRVARETAKALGELGYKTVLVRDSDVFVELPERARVAHLNGADAFISIHHNAPGYSTDPRTTRYHAVYAWNEIGERLASSVNAKMSEALDGDIPSKGVIHANFAVTRNPEIPSCLVEVDFVTSPEGEEAIWTAARRRFIAKAIAAGVDEWRRGGPAE